MLERYLTAASTYAHWVDYQFILIAVLVGFWLIVAEAVMFWLIFKFRAKDGRPTQYITGEEKQQTRWITIPHFLVIVCDLVIIVPAILLWYNIKQVLPPADETVRVIAQQWAWSFQQAGPANCTSK
jgi:cytochrome c oxidase subunit 2